MDIKIHSILFLLCCVPFITMAQPLNQATPEYLLRMAEQKMELHDYYNALEQYELYYEDHKDDLEVAFKIAMLEFKLRDYEDAERSFRSLIRRVDRGKNRKNRRRTTSTALPDMPNLRLYYARTLKFNEEYEAAVEQYGTYIGDEAEDPAMARLAKLELEGVRMAMQAEMPADITVAVLEDPNCKSADESPTLNPRSKEMLYTSLQTDEVIILDDNKKGEDDEESVPYMRIFSSKQAGDSDNWSKGEALDQVINREGYHTGNPAYSADGSVLFFTRSLLDGEQVLESKIYYSRLSEDGWGAAQEVAGVNGDYIATHPAPGELYGNPVLFFSANIDGGGSGGFDIYYATLQSEGRYKSPVNLGKAINTMADEVTPFYNDGVLYFSSDGYKSFGGFDVYRSEWNGSSWSAPENMGKGVNSSVDDRFFRTDESGYQGFVVSNRANGGRSLRGKTCCDDIWSYTKKKIDASAEVAAKDAVSNKPLYSVTAVLIDVSKDGNREDPTSYKSNEGKTIPIPLEIEKSYQVIVYSDGYVPDTTVLTTVGLTDSKVFQIPISLQPDGPIYDTVVIECNEPIRLNRIYYDFDDDKILPEAEKDLAYLLELLNEYPEMVIELSSHTDARGNDSYNESLSQRRANSAKTWLTTRGVDTKRIVAKGYGETQILNRCQNEVDCTEEEHRYNRRTEFKIIDGPTSIKVRKERVKEVGVEEEKPAPQTGQVIKDKVIPEVKVNFKETKYELGTVRKGETPSFTYYFVNVGTTPVEIDIISGCDCTDIEWPEGKVFQRLEKGEIKVTYRSADETEKIGKLEKTIDLYFKQQDPKTGMPLYKPLKFILMLAE